MPSDSPTFPIIFTVIQFLIVWLCLILHWAIYSRPQIREIFRTELRDYQEREHKLLRRAQHQNRNRN